MHFSTLGISNELEEILKKENVTTPTPIQEQAIPIVLKNKDILGIAKTGSGKTLSYILPIIQTLSKQKEVKNRDIDALILVPTRELAIQVQEVFHNLSKQLTNNIKSMAVYGGVSINPQMKGLFGVNVLIATPGRLIELTQSNALNLNKTQILVLDEADKMLTKDFEEEMASIFALLPKKRQNLLFSATLSDKVQDFQQGLLNNPSLIKMEEAETDIRLINQVAYYVSEEKKGPLLRYLIKKNNWSPILLFVSSAKKADNVTNKLNNNGIDAVAIHSKKSTFQRKTSLEAFKAKHIGVLVSTDVLARGIDIDKLPYVINYELPRSPQDYVHRIGRTGRANEKGEAISFISPSEEQHFKTIQKKMGLIVNRIDGEAIEMI